MAKHDIILLGLNHNTAPIELRECIAFSPEETESALEALRSAPAIGELILLSTCNRVEILMAATEREQAVADAKAYLSASKQLKIEQFEDVLYQHVDKEAVRHVFRVAASLDSMIVGEPQILGQLKDAYLLATQQKTSGVILNRLLHRAFFVAKRVRTETGIGDHAVSISYAAIELGRKIFGQLDGKKVLLIGAGEMAELAVEHLIRQRAGDIYVANRTFERGVALAQKFKGHAIRFEEIGAYLETVDVVIGSTGAGGYVIKTDQVKRRLRKRRSRPLFFIDIAVPRDIDPDIHRLPNTYVYDIDDLRGVVDENIKDREREAVKGERIVDEAVVHFLKWYEGLAVVPTIIDLRRRIELLVNSEIDKTLQQIEGLSESDRQTLDRMRTSLAKKIAHNPTVFLKSDGCRADRSLYLDVTRKLFKLDE